MHADEKGVGIETGKGDPVVDVPPFPVSRAILFLGDRERIVRPGQNHLDPRLPKKIGEEQDDREVQVLFVNAVHPGRAAVGSPVSGVEHHGRGRCRRRLPRFGVRPRSRGEKKRENRERKREKAARDPSLRHKKAPLSVWYRIWGATAFYSSGQAF